MKEKLWERGRHCGKITGKGLGSLMSSRGLRELDLRTVPVPPATEHTWQPKHENAIPAARVLEPRFISALLLKMLRRNKVFHLLKFALIDDPHFQLQEVKREVLALDTPFCCGACGADAVISEFTLLNAQNFSQCDTELPCEGCSKQSCQSMTAPCNSPISSCDYCSKLTCNDCNMAMCWCESCHRFSCGDWKGGCAISNRCDGTCGKLYCAECINFPCPCDTCGRYYCCDCVNTGGTCDCFSCNRR